MSKWNEPTPSQTCNLGNTLKVSLKYTQKESRISNGMLQKIN